jgi:hypothetical protein
MASMSPGVAQDERLMDQLKKISGQEDNPKPLDVTGDSFFAKKVISAHSAIPVFRHEKKNGNLTLNNGYQKSYTPFKKSLDSKVKYHLKRQIKEDEKDGLSILINCD